MDTKSNNNLSQHLLEESFAMIKHLSADGKEIPAMASKILNCENKDCIDTGIAEKDILILHKDLSKRIAPARPNSVWLIYSQSQTARWLNFLGPVKLIRRLMVVAIISLFLFILISSSVFIDYRNITEGIFTLAGWNLLIVLSFYFTAASLGATFSNLFEANRYIIKNTYDPKYEASYWIRYVLGIIAGIMLATIIPLPDFSGREGLAIASRPMLAMLGGFSAALVYRILFQIVYAVESVFVGKQEVKIDNKIASIRLANEMEKENEKQKIVNYLLNLQGQLIQGKKIDQINAEIQKKITELTE